MNKVAAYVAARMRGHKPPAPAFNPSQTVIPPTPADAPNELVLVGGAAAANMGAPVAIPGVLSSACSR